MKRVPSLFLAVMLLTTGVIGAMAAETGSSRPMTIEDFVDSNITTGYNASAPSGFGAAFDYEAEAAIREITFVNGRMKAEFDEATINGLDFTIPITAVKAGDEHIHIYVEYQKDGRSNIIGSGTDITVVDKDNPVPEPPSTSGDGSNNVANSDATTSEISTAIKAIKANNPAAVLESAVIATTASGASVTAIPVSLTSGSANILVGTANLIGSGNVALKASVDNGAMEVLLPGGFGQITEPGRIYYPFNFSNTSEYADVMTQAVKGNAPAIETIKAGGSMTLPTTATVTLRTRITKTVRVYHYDELTRRYTLLATVTPNADGKITFATNLMGNMVITTGTI